MGKNEEKVIDNKDILRIGARYIVLLLAGIVMYYSQLFYNVFLVLTIYPSNFLLNFSYDSKVVGDLIVLGAGSVQIIPACIGVSAYFLLLILNLTTNMTLKKRVFSILFSFILLLIINIMRIALMSALYFKKIIYFDAIHLFTWYFLSIIVVVGIWFLVVYIFRIKNTPIYGDFKRILLSYANTFSKSRRHQRYNRHKDSLEDLRIIGPAKGQVIVEDKAPDSSGIGDKK